jgi:hypothetical protein
MSGESLFPEQYPDDATAAEPKPSCCQNLVAPPGVPLRPWELMHAICHGRIPFTLDAFTLIADCTALQAKTAIRQAGQRDWLHRVWPEPYMVDPPEQWVGCLPKRR